MKQYLLTVNHTEGDPPPSPDQMEQIFHDVDTLNGEMQGAGVEIFAGGLHEPSTATVVRVVDDEVLTTDGPFAESKEYIGGFWVIKATDLDEALGWAEKATRACRLPVEVRPFQEEPQD
ncbi:MAG: hypothetical protein KY469_04515 [Actinobacteria bacterium]|nr:hypothetical protein [Actinomycetota bacterium]